MAILTPLLKAFECRYCLAGFSFNLQLYQHIRESYSKKNASIAIVAKTTTTYTRSPSASRAIVSLTTSLITSRIAVSRIASSYIAYLASPHIIRPVTLPLIYRAILPPSLVYKAYLIVQNLYMRYAPLKSILLALKLARNTTSYLTVQNLYNQFKFSRKSYFGTVKWTIIPLANKTVTFGSKQSLKSASFLSKASVKSIEKNIAKVVYSTKIGPSDIKLAFDLKISSLNSFQASYLNVKTPFSLRQIWNVQVLIIQSPCYMKSFKHIRMVARIRIASYKRLQ